MQALLNRGIIVKLPLHAGYCMKKKTIGYSSRYELIAHSQSALKQNT